MKTITLTTISGLFIFVFVACGGNDADPTPTPTPAPTPTEDVAPPADDTAVADEFDPNAVFRWNNFVGRDPHNRPETASSGAPILWDNWTNMRTAVVGDGIHIDFRPMEFDPEDFDDYEDYFAHADDWMGNWGESIDMWSLDGISYCRYMTIVMRGIEGGEERALMLHMQPNDGPSFAARFSDLILQGGGRPQITTYMQSLVIDLEASGLPGMTNRMNILAFAPAGIILNEIYFHSPIFKPT